MLPAPFRVVLDACVLLPMTLCDTILRCAERDLYQLYWTDEILREGSEALVRTKHASRPKAEKRFAAMREAFPDALVTDYEALVASMQTDPGDRHVAAAAVKAGAQVIVTANLKHFAKLPSGIEAQSPDEFLGNLLDLKPELMIELLQQQADDHENPPTSLDELLAALAKSVPDFVAAVRAHIGR